jgi:hypothetical protein
MKNFLNRFVALQYASCGFCYKNQEKSGMRLFVKYAYALVVVLVITGGCSRQPDAALSVSQLTAYTATQEPTCRSALTVGGSIKYSCAQ